MGRAHRRPGYVICTGIGPGSDWQLVAVEDVWGMGRQYATKLYGLGITTAAGLAQCSEAMAPKHLGGVVGARLVRELQGYPCHRLAPSGDGTLAQRSLCRSRTFGKPLSAFDDVLSAIGISIVTLCLSCTLGINRRSWPQLASTCLKARTD